MKKNAVIGLAAMMTLSAMGMTAFAEEAASGSLTNLKVEDVAQLVDFTFDEAITTYEITVFEDVYGVRFTPSITGGADSSVTVTMSGTGIEEETLTVGKNEQFELHLSEARECSAFEERVMEDDCDYEVVIEAANDTYTINVHRPGSDGLSDQFEQKTWSLDDDKEMIYYLYVPEGYSEDKEYPVVVVPHGGGQFAVDSKDTLVRTAQATAFAKYDKDAIVIVPHGNYSDLSYEEDYGWVNFSDIMPTIFGDAVYDILMDVCANYSVDENKIIMAGGSMGGVGTMGMVAAHPEVYAAAVIACPAVFDPESGETNLAAIKYFADQIQDYNIALWLVHSEADPTVSYDTTAQLKTFLDAYDVRYNQTIYSESDYLWPTAHFSWVPFFDNEENLDWMLSQSK